MNDPAQDLLLAMIREQGDSTYQSALNFATPQSAANLIQYSQEYPLGGANLGLGLTIGGIPASDPLVGQLVQDEITLSPTLGPIEESGEGWWNSLTGIWDEAVDNNVKGATRWAFAAWDAAYNMFAGGAPIRAQQQAGQEGTSFGAAWQDQDPYFFEALGGVFAGERVNLGSGWMPSSDVADDVSQNVIQSMMDIERQTESLPTNEKYATRLKAAPQVWNDAVSMSAEQAALGTPITELAARQAEGVMFNVPQLGGGSVQTPWSPGRYATAFVMEPGTEGFAKVSGLGDFTAQIFADPAEYLGLGWARAGVRGRTLFAQADKVEKASQPALKLTDEAGQGIGYSRQTPAPEGFYGPGGDMAALTPDDLPVDPTIELAEGMKLQVGEPTPGIDQMGFDDALSMPDWSSPQTMGRQTGPGDPPDFYRNAVNSTLEDARRIRDDQKAVMVEKGFWTIADEAGKPIHIQKMEDGKWLVTDDVGNVISSGHRTKNAAVENIKGDFDRNKVKTDMFGMTVEEFNASGDDLFLGGNVTDLPSQTNNIHNGRAKETPMHTAGSGPPVVAETQEGAAALARLERKAERMKASPVVTTVDIKDGRMVIHGSGDLRFGFDEKTGEFLGGIEGGFRENPIMGTARNAQFRGVNTELRKSMPGFGKNAGPIEVTPEAIAAVMGNTRVRVFGKTVDGVVPVDSMDDGLQAALRKDRKVRQNQVIGFGNPKVEKWEATKSWMRENGYGKLDMGDGNYLIVDEYIGGNLNDPMSRVWHSSGDQPISSYSVGSDTLDTIDSVTPNEVNQLIDFIVDKGARMTNKELRAVAKMDGATKDQLASINRAVQQASESKAALTNVRPDYDKLATTNLLAGSRSGMFLDRLWAGSRASGQKNAVIVDKLLDVFDKKGIPIPVGLRNDLFNARSREETQVLFSRWLASEGGGQALLPGGMGETGFGRLAGMSRHSGGIKEPRFPKINMLDKPWLARRLAQGIPHEAVNMVEDPDKAYSILNRILPNFNLSRGQEIALYDNAGELTGGTVNIEELFGALRTMGPGRKVQAYDLMGQFAEVFFSSLVDDGVSPTLAKQAKRWWGELAEEAIFDAERAANVKLTMGSGEAAFINGEMVHGLGPQLTAQAWDGTMHFPDPKQIRRVANESDRLGKIANRITSKVDIDETLPGKYGNETLQDRTWYRYANSIMNNVWKPLVLLRAAWTIRIAIDDQMRIAADGYGVFNHPMRIWQYGTTMPKDWWDLFRKGSVDINGVKFDPKDLSALQHEDLYRKALMRARDEKLGPGSYGFRQTRRVTREDHAKYVKGLTTDVKQLRGSTITKVLADSKADDPVHETVLWLQGKGGNNDQVMSGIRERQELAGIHRRMSDPEDTANTYTRIMQGNDYDLLYDVVSKQYATLHQKTGGIVYLNDGNGVLRNYGNLEIRDIEKVDETGKAAWVIEQRGDDDLLRVVAGDDKLYGDLNTDESMGALERALGTKVKANGERFPMFTRASDETRAGYTESLGDVYNSAVRKMFDLFMTTPSNTLSRSPLFERSYWQKMTEIYPYMDDALQRQFRSIANDANISLAQRQVRRVGKSGVDEVGGQIRNMDQADGLAKSHALTQVEKTLFDMSNKRNISESLNLIFPFVEAWGEFLSRWGRIMVTGDRSIANARRFQQGIEGARDSGFFYENEFGQEVFNYPAFLTKAQIGVHNTLNNLPVLGQALGEDVSGATAEALTQGQMFKPADAGMRQPSSVTGSVESMNFASGIIPGFGPVFQMAAKQVLPDDPKWDEVRDIVSPFGTEGSAIGGLMPAWVKRISASLGGGGDAQLSYQFTSSVQDIIRTQIDNGEWSGVQSPEEVNAKVAEAEDMARGLLMVRAAATYWTPASPSYRFQKQDVNGMVWSYSNLGNEYRKILEEQNSDENATYAEFNRRFGFLPHPFIGGRTYSTVDRSRTEEGFKFERANPELFNRYPSTAMYLDPSGGVGTYDHDATLRQLKEGERQAWTGDQMIYLQQDQLGDLMFDNVKNTSKGMESAAERDAYVSANRAEIQELYPLWNQPIPGKAQSYTNEQQMAEVRAWMTDPAVMGTSAAQGARIYMQERDAIMAQIEVLGGKTLSATSQTTEQGQISNIGRQSLRSLADEITLQYPQFGPLFDSVFSYEVRAELDFGDSSVDTLTENAFGDGGDLFTQLLQGAST